MTTVTPEDGIPKREGAWQAAALSNHIFIQGVEQGSKCCIPTQCVAFGEGAGVCHTEAQKEHS